MLFPVSHKSSVPYQFLVMSGVAHCSQDWGHEIKCMHGFPSVNILLTTKVLSHDPLSGDMDCLLTLWSLLIPCFLDNSCCTSGFLIFIIVERNSLYNSLLHTYRKIIKAPLFHQRLGSPWLSFSLSLSLPLANSLERGNPPSSLSCPGFQDLFERTPCAFVSSASPVQWFYWFST